MRKYWILLCLVCPVFVKAGIALEPFAGYGASWFPFQQTFYQGPALGGRVGYKRWGVMMSLDTTYRFLSPFNPIKALPESASNVLAHSGLANLSPTKTIVSPDIDARSAYHIITLGPSISFDLPFVTDAYCTLIAWSLSKNNTQNLIGSGGKCGIYYNSLPFIRLNMEYEGLYHYRCTSLETGQACEQKKEEDLTTGMAHTVSISISVPINTGFL